MCCQSTGPANEVILFGLFVLNGFRIFISFLSFFLKERNAAVSSCLTIPELFYFIVFFFTAQPQQSACKNVKVVF